MIQTLRNAWRIPELRKKILFTMFILLIYRFGAAIPVPFLNTEALSAAFDAVGGSGSGNGLFGLFDMMSGGALKHGTIFALSIQPYINASIIMQLLTVGIPALERLQKEGGEDGRKKIASITRYATVGLGIIQGFAYYMMLRNTYTGSLLNYNALLQAVVIIATFTAGTALIMWLGEQITEFGIGNGISIILFASIVSRIVDLPTSIIEMFQKKEYFLVLLMGAAFLAIIALVVFISNAERRIPVQYAKRVVGRKMYGGQSTHLPMKVNMSGVMPIIFAQAIASFPATIAMFFPKSGFATFMQNNFSQTKVIYMVIYFLLIIAFAYFYQSIQFNPIEISNNLKQNGGFVPGFRPGRPTSDFIKRVLNKITLFGAIFLGFIAILPLVMANFSNSLSGMALGGTSILIIVGVALETMRQLESQMMMRHYKGFLE